MKLLSKFTVTLHRHTGVSAGYDENGDYSEGDLTESQIPCSIQPSFQGIIHKNLPEGVRSKDCRTIHTETLLLTGEEDSAVRADYITYDGVQYEIFDLRPWRGVRRLKHYEAVMIRRDKINGVNNP